MEKRKVWQLFSSLQPEEAGHFGRWLEAELYEKQHYLRRMKDCLTRHYPEAPTDEVMWAYLYPDKSYDDGRLRKLAGDLLSKLEEFLAIEAFRRDKDLRDLTLLQEINRRGRPELFIKKAHKFEKEINDREHRNGDFFRLIYELEIEKLQYENNYRKAFPGQALNNPPFSEEFGPRQKMSYAFDSWFMNEKMFIAIANSSEARVSGEEIDNTILKDLQKTISSHHIFKNLPWLLILQELYLLMNEDGITDLNNLLNMVRANREQIPDTDLLMLFAVTLNYYVFILNKSGEPQAGYQIFSLYEWAIEEKLIFFRDVLPAIHYKNIITICLRIGDFDAAWKYLHEFKRLLSDEEREDIYHLMLAQYYVRKNHPQDVVRTLSNRKFRNVTDEINARSFLLEAFYELNREDVSWLYSQTDQLIRFIRRKDELSPTDKKPYLNRFKLFKRMLNAYTRQELEQVRNSIKKADPIDRPDWLLKKISLRLEEINR